MMQLAIRNYIRAFRWQNVKESYNNGGWFTLLYLAVFCPILFNDFQIGSGTLTDILLLFPNIYVMFTSVLYPMTLPKIMYLCPMSKEMRKDYILKACFVRTIVPVAMNIIVVIILLSNRFINPVCAIGVFLNNLIFSVFLGSGTNMKGYGKIDEKGQRSMSIDDGFSLKEFLIVFCNMILCVAYGSIGPLDAPWVSLLFIGITLLIPLPVTISYLKYWPSAVENALSYESCMNKPTKLKK